MVTKVLKVIAMVLLIATHASAAEIRGECEVRFEVTATLHDFSGSGKCLPFSAPLERTPGGDNVLPLVAVAVPVAGMETGNGGRDKDMRKMFEADRHPDIHASARGIDADALRRRMREDPAGKAPLEVVVAIRGVERKVQASAGAYKEEGNRLSFEIGFPVSLKEFMLKAPSAFGLIRVADRVVVNASFTVEIVEDPR